MRALLDVNVLIALLDSAHVGHLRATAWLRKESAKGWASCPITQNGCVRVMSQPAYPGAMPVAEVAARLTEATLHATHEFWSDNVSMLEPGVLDGLKVLGHRQVTDSHLLALAVRHQGRFVTFDARVNGAAVHGAKAKHLMVL